MIQRKSATGMSRTMRKKVLSRETSAGPSTSNETGYGAGFVFGGGWAS